MIMLSCELSESTSHVGELDDYVLDCVVVSYYPRTFRADVFHVSTITFAASINEETNNSKILGIQTMKPNKALRLGLAQYVPCIL